MNAVPPSSTAPRSNTQAQSSRPNIDLIGQNIEAILTFYLDEERNVTSAQRILESVSGFLGQPLCFGLAVVFVILWILANVLAKHMGFAPFDAPPFPWLQGIIGLGALLIMMMILIKQNRLAKIEERRAHLELQVNLLTEQKVTKLITLMEELRHDLPMIKDRHDPEAVAYQQPTDPKSVLAALDERLDAAPPPAKTAF